MNSIWKPDDGTHVRGDRDAEGRIFVQRQGTRGWWVTPEKFAAIQEAARRSYAAYRAAHRADTGLMDRRNEQQRRRHAVNRAGELLSQADIRYRIHNGRVPSDFIRHVRKGRDNGTIAVLMRVPMSRVAQWREQVSAGEVPQKQLTESPAM